MNTRPRLLLVTRNLPPLTGGMERLNWHLADELSARFDVEIVGPVGSASLAPAGVVVHEVGLRPLPTFLLRALGVAVARSRTWRPDVVLAGSGLTAPIVWLAARGCGASAAAYIHGLDLTVPHPLYRLMWLPFIRRMRRVIVNSSATVELALKAGVPFERLATVNPGVSLPAQTKVEHLRDRARFRSRLGLGAEKVVLSVGRLTERKGLLQFVEAVLPRVAAKHPDVRMVVIGSAPRDALHARPQSSEAIMVAARRVGQDANVIFLGNVSQQQLDEAYRGADVHVFPVRDSPFDPEGFGMVAIEAAAHGLPTVAYATGGVIDAVGDGRSGRLVKPGDVDGFAGAVIEQIETPIATEIIRSFAAQFAWPRFGDQICLELTSLVRGRQ